MGITSNKLIRNRDVEYVHHNPIWDTFVAAALSSTIAATSPDGITWTQRTLPVSAQWRSVTYAKLNTRKLSST